MIHFLQILFGFIKSRKIRWERHVSLVGKKRNVYNVVMWKHQGKRLLGRPTYRWDDHIKMGL
jgi:hypothetical protein